MSAITTTGRTRRGPLLQLDLASLRRLIGDRPWDHLEHDAGLAKSQIARIFERGGGSFVATHSMTSAERSASTKASCS